MLDGFPGGRGVMDADRAHDQAGAAGAHAGTQLSKQMSVLHVCDHRCSVHHLFGNAFRCDSSGQVGVATGRGEGGGAAAPRRAHARGGARLASPPPRHAAPACRAAGPMQRAAALTSPRVPRRRPFPARRPARAGPRVRRQLLAARVPRPLLHDMPHQPQGLPQRLRRAGALQVGARGE
jgi:hypothetical protein